MTLSDIYATLQSDSGPAKPAAADRIRQEAWRSPVAFTDFLRSVPLNETCALFEVYAVLLQDSQHFSEILLSELTRLLESAKGLASTAAGLFFLERSSPGAGSVAHSGSQAVRSGSRA
jgi:hypothetical protein